MRRGGRAYGRLDRWWNSYQLELAAARDMAARIERRASAADEITARETYLDLLGVRAGRRVLEVGSGSGAVLREIARRVAPDGRAVGLEYGPAMLTIARELAAQEGAPDVMELHQGDARALPFGDDQFDVVLAVTSLSHIPEGARAVPEMVRVTRPGGLVGVFDRDTDAYIISHPDRELTRVVVAAYSDHGQTDGWIARRMPGLLTEAGLLGVQVRAFASIERDPEGFYAVNAVRCAEVALEIGAVSPDEHDRWLTALRAEQAAGRFISGMTQILSWGRKPEA